MKTSPDKKQATSVLESSFFARPALRVSEELIGMYLVFRKGGKETASMITEVEAYDGPQDLASHARRGETPRTKIMFGPAGVWYVYLIYGMYSMLNVVTGDAGYPAAILIRGTIDVSGPGRLTKALGIDRSYNGHTVTPDSGLWIEDRGVRFSKKDILRTPRIGVGYAGEVWSMKPYRFILKAGAKGKRKGSE